MNSIYVCKPWLLLFCCSLVFSIPPEHAPGEIYYVSPTGSDANSGLSQSDAWKSIAFAASHAVPGDTIYVQRGIYLNENVVFPVDGTEVSPITLAGYQLTPGDEPDPSFEYGDALDPSIMPVLNGLDRCQGVAIQLHNRRHITLKNLQISDYEVGISCWNSVGVTIDNVIAERFGDIQDDYSGKAFTVSFSEGCIIRDCFVLNAAAEGINVIGDNNLVKNCRVYADDNSTGFRSATDYYIHVSGNWNLIDGCSVERIGDLQHGGHGIGVKGECEFNTFVDCSARNLGSGFYVRHRNCRFNLFNQCTAIDGYSGLLVRDGADCNLFSNCRTKRHFSAIAFMDTAEDGGSQWAGRFNEFVNGVFEASEDCGINFHYYDRDTSAAHNRFINCLFTESPHLFRCERTNQDNQMINCIVANVSSYETGTHELFFEFTRTNFWGCGFDLPDGELLLDSEPLFFDLANGDYRLRSGSPCIDTGENASVPPSIEVDHLGSPRFVDDPNTADTGSGTAPLVDIGPMEYRPALLGDVNRDGFVNGLDIAPFVVAIGISDYQLEVDTNRDGSVNLLDIDSFIAILGGG